MNRKTYCILFLAIITLVLFGCSGGGKDVSREQPSEQDDLVPQPLSLTQVTEVLSRSGITLEKVEEAKREDLAWNGVTPPYVFNINGDLGKLYIYVYPSTDDRREVALPSTKIFSSEDNLPAALSKRYMSIYPLTSKNVLMILDHTRDLNITGPMNPIWDTIFSTFKTIKKSVFEDLNEGKTYTFKGESKHWQAELVLRTYQYFWDSNGVGHVEGRTEEEGILTYTGANASNIKHLEYQCINDLGEISKGIFNTANFDGDIEFGGFGMGNGSLQANEDTYAVIIKWDERQETVELKQ